MTRVAFVTYARLPGLSDDDRLAAAALAARGARVDAVRWDDAEIDWSAYDLVVLRSTWDYHTRLDEFLAWVERLARGGVPLANAPAVLAWNARKTYLRDLVARGARVAPTLWATAPDAEPLDDLLARAGWTRAVVKPVVSASAHRTWEARAGGGPAQERRWRETLAAAGDVMVQAFAEPVVRDGEWSLVFLDGAFSHAVLKRPAPGDFRVQHEHGGTAAPAIADTEMVVSAAAVLALAPAPTLYARVDGWVDAKGFVLMELELLEPSLFLALDAGAPARFADAVLRAVPDRAPDCEGPAGS